MIYFYDLGKSNKEYAWNSKFIITNILMIPLFLLWIIFVPLTHNTFVSSGWGVNSISSTLTTSDELIRLWLLLICSLMLLIAVYNIYATIRSGLNNIFLLTLGLFNWVFLYMFIRQSNNYRLFQKFLHNHKFADNEIKQISYINLYWWIRGNDNFNRVTANTILHLVNILFYFIGFIFILIPSSKVGYDILDTTFSYNVTVYFTKLTNIGCFLFLIGFPYFQNKRLYSSNRLAINMCSYISVVAIIYWVLLFPVSVSSGSFSQQSGLDITENIWLHAFTPILFISFILNSSGISLTLQKGNYLKRAGIVQLYPLWYMTYAYSIPFLIRESVYGAYTNLNPYGYIGSVDGYVKNGNPLYVFTIFGFGLLFAIMMFIFIGLVNLINKNNYRFKNINSI